MTERELDAAVRKLIKAYGLWAFHPYDSRRSQPGWPDWCVIGRRIIYRELKSQDGRLSGDQARVRDLIISAGGDWAVWRPADLASGRIARELAAVAR